MSEPAPLPRAAKVALVVVLVGVAFALRGRRGPAAGAATPEAAVKAFFDAAERGDDRAYLRLATGDLRRSLEATRAQQGAEAYRAGLKQSVQGVTAIVIKRLEDAAEGTVALDVELVLVDRYDNQRVVLERQRGGWVIVDLGPVRTSKPLIPYGTPVFPGLGADKK